jgi:hypothetical protein
VRENRFAFGNFEVCLQRRCLVRRVWQVEEDLGDVESAAEV